MMNEESFIKFIDNYITKIKFIRFLKDIEDSDEDSTFKFTNTSQYYLRALIYFDSQDSADNFYYEYNTKHYPSNKFEFLYCVYTDKVYFDYHKQNKCINKNGDICLLLDPNKEQSQLFFCPLCLEKIDNSCSGIHTIVNMINVERWVYYKKNCKICRRISNKSVINKCYGCAQHHKTITNNIWCCMICGFTGCDRYQQGHLVEHFNNTLHRYSIDLMSQRIWDYLSDGWVHKVIKIHHESENENKNMMIFFDHESDRQPSENLNTKEFLIRMENIVSEYNFTLSFQLEEQRKYYEKEISKLNEINENKIKNKLCYLNSLKEELKNKNSNVENNKKLQKEYQKKINQQGKKINQIKDDLNLNDQLIINLTDDIEKENKYLDEFKMKNENQIINETMNNKIKKKDNLEKKLNDMYISLGDK